MRLPVHLGDRNRLCRPIKIQSFDNETLKFNVLAPLQKQLKRSKVNKAYEHFVFCNFETQKERLRIDREISVGYRFLSLTIFRGMKEERFHLEIVCAVSGKKRLVLNMHDCSAKNARESKKRQTTSATSIQQLQSLESILKSPLWAQTIMQTSIEYRKRATFLFR